MNLVTITEAAEIAGLTRGRIWQIINAGELPATLYGHTWLITREELDRFLAERKSVKVKNHN